MMNPTDKSAGSSRQDPDNILHEIHELLIQRSGELVAMCALAQAQAKLLCCFQERCQENLQTVHALLRTVAKKRGPRGAWQQKRVAERIASLPENLTVAEIAKRAGTSERTVYRYRASNKP